MTCGTDGPLERETRAAHANFTMTQAYGELVSATPSLGVVRCLQRSESARWLKLIATVVESRALSEQLWVAETARAPLELRESFSAKQLTWWAPSPAAGSVQSVRDAIRRASHQ